MDNLTVQSATVVDIISNNGSLADTTKYQYIKAVRNAVNAGVDIANAEQLAKYAGTLNKSSRGFLKAAIRLWSKQLELAAKGGATPDSVAAVQAVVYRIEALNEAIKVTSDKGDKLHTWLSVNEVKQLVNTCDSSLRGQRDRVVLGLLVGAGVRRDELIALQFSDIELIPYGDKFRTVLQVTGKGDKSRTVPISDSLAALLDKWQAVVGGGRVARSISQVGELGDSLSVIGVFNIVRAAGVSIGKRDLAPHDLRRSFAQLSYEAGVPILQISKDLGHSSIKTTQTYLRRDRDMAVAGSDFIPV